MNTSRIKGDVLIIGTGLVGTSIGLSLRRAGVTVLLSDADPAHLQEACDRGAGRALTAGDDPAVVVVAVPPSVAPAVMAQASRDFPYATITDVTSVKAPILSAAIAAGADPMRLVGGHPMAGREVSGPSGARAELLDDRLWVLVPAQADEGHVMQVHRLVTACGAYAVEMDPEEHDQAVALVSHAPQVVSSALAAQLVPADAAHVRIAGQGLRDMTRIAGSSVDLWTSILSVNAEPVADVLDALADRLTDTARRLRSGQSVQEVLQTGVSGQARIPGKHGAVAEQYREIPVVLADRSGELARMFAVAAEAGVNVEDVRIEHVLGRPSGLVQLYVAPRAGDALVTALRARDFEVRD